jgi:hypothetical protein
MAKYMPALLESLQPGGTAPDYGGHVSDTICARLYTPGVALVPQEALRETRCEVGWNSVGAADPGRGQCAVFD